MEQICAQIEKLLEQGERVVVAIDGNCTAGKTTLASALQKRYDCNVFHMDDFFLRPTQRTPERLAQPGGNVDYERFREEVLIPLGTGVPFSYRPYDCHACRLRTPVAVTPKQLNVVEGTYSQHPYFGDVYDLRVFLTVPPQVQAQRIRQRPAALHEKFFQTWIPMEQRYFEHFHIDDSSTVVLGPNCI